MKNNTKTNQETKSDCSAAPCSPPEGFKPYCLEEDLPVWELLQSVEGNAPLIKIDDDQT